MKHFKFYNIKGREWLTMHLLAVDIASAVKDFNLLWGTGMRYEVEESGDFGCTQQLFTA